MSLDTPSMPSRCTRRSLVGASFAAVAIVALSPFDHGQMTQRLAGRGGGEPDTLCQDQGDVSQTPLNPMDVRGNDGRIVHRGP